MMSNTSRCVSATNADTSTIGQDCSNTVWSSVQMPRLDTVWSSGHLTSLTVRNRLLLAVQSKSIKAELHETWKSDSSVQALKDGMLQLTVGSNSSIKLSNSLNLAKYETSVPMPIILIWLSCVNLARNSKSLGARFGNRICSSFSPVHEPSFEKSIAVALGSTPIDEQVESFSVRRLTQVSKPVKSLTRPFKCNVCMPICVNGFKSVK